MLGTKMRPKYNVKILDLINAEIQVQFNNACNEIRNEAKKQILKVQYENCKTYNLRCKTAPQYKINNLVAIKRTHFGPGFKFKQKYLGPHNIVKVKPNKTYDLEKSAFLDGPVKTSTCAVSCYGQILLMTSLNYILCRSVTFVKLFWTPFFTLSIH